MIDTFALWLGYAMMMTGGLGILGFIIWNIFDDAFKIGLIFRDVYKWRQAYREKNGPWPGG
jgi:hypothetical protein